jgi:O-methyltransferase
VGFLVDIMPDSAIVNHHNLEILTKVQAYTYCSVGKLKNLINICEYLNATGVSGDFVECGTYKGGSAAVISKFLTSDKHLWLYDSFAGMPETSIKDGIEAKKWVGGCLATEEDVKEVMRLVSTDKKSFTIRKGWFEETFITYPLPDKVALLHCDADWYNSVHLVLETFYHRVSEGGCIILDDFGFWEGCREAFYDFCYKHQLKPLIERVESDQAFWIKGKNHNRELPSYLKC